MVSEGRRLSLLCGLVILCLLSTGTYSLKECIADSPVTFEDSEVLEHIKNCIGHSDRYSITHNTMDSLLKNGFLKSADYALKNYFLKQSVDISEQMKTTIMDLKARLEGLLKMISQVKKALIAMPVFMWGQSEDSIFVHVKFSHRFDTPGCLDITAESFEIKDNKLLYQANCMQTHQPINFVLDINLFEEAVDEGKVIRKGSVGTRVLEFKKKEKTIWRNLHDDTEKFSRLQMRVWWEIKDVYPKAMKEYAKLLEQDEEDDEELWGDLAKKGKKPAEEEPEDEQTKENQSSEATGDDTKSPDLDSWKIATGPTETDL